MQLGYNRAMLPTPPLLFNRPRLRAQATRAAPHFAQHDFLWHEAAARVEESLSFIARRFSRILAFGAHGLATPPGATLLHAAFAPLGNQPQVIVDEECLPFAPESFDAALCVLNLHVVNDVPGVLAQLQRCLKPDGLLMAVVFGGETLRELRSIFASVEAARSGGVSPRVAPFMDVRDGGALLQRAGFALPVADSELFTVSYDNLFALMHEIRGMGQANMLQQQLQHFTPRGFFLDAAKRYAEEHTDSDGRITATVEFITLTGWKPAATQQQPAKRGSGKVSLKDVLKAPQ